MSHGGGGGLKSAEKCHVLFEWPLTPNNTKWLRTAVLKDTLSAA